MTTNRQRLARELADNTSTSYQRALLAIDALANGKPTAAMPDFDRIDQYERDMTPARTITGLVLMNLHWMNHDFHYGIESWVNGYDEVNIQWNLGPTPLDVLTSLVVDDDSIEDDLSSIRMRRHWAVISTPDHWRIGLSKWGWRCSYDAFLEVRYPWFREAVTVRLRRDQLGWERMSDAERVRQEQHVRSFHSDATNLRAAMRGRPGFEWVPSVAEEPDLPNRL